MSASGRGTVPRKFLSTPSARRATATVKDLALELVISIHALREEGDYSLTGTALSASDFYPRPPRGGRRISYRRDAATMRISIHALREEGDRLNRNSENRFAEFLSTPSARRATDNYIDDREKNVISIHALREEGDPPA